MKNIFLEITQINDLSYFIKEWDNIWIKFEKAYTEHYPTVFIEETFKEQLSHLVDDLESIDDFKQKLFVVPFYLELYCYFYIILNTAKKLKVLPSELSRVYRFKSHMDRQTITMEKQDATIH